MRLRTNLIIAGTLAAALVLTSSIVSARSDVVRPSRFFSNGDHIADWYWLRANGHTAVWTFDTRELRGARPGSVFLNFSPLVTNRLNGGSGYDVVCRATIVPAGGAAAGSLTITLSNPFRPIDPDSSGGLGYPVYGHSTTAISPAILNSAEQITVAISYPFTPNYHLAVNRDAMVIGYRR